MELFIVILSLSSCPYLKYVDIDEAWHLNYLSSVLWQV